jgi:hypothetical protein
VAIGHGRTLRWAKKREHMSGKLSGGTCTDIRVLLVESTWCQSGILIDYSWKLARRWMSLTNRYAAFAPNNRQQLADNQEGEQKRPALQLRKSNTITRPWCSIIAAEPRGCGGEQSLMVRWARVVLEKDDKRSFAARAGGLVGGPARATKLTPERRGAIAHRNKSSALVAEECGRK